MALDVAAIRAAVIAAVETEFDEQFGDSPPTTSEAIATALGEVFGAASDVMMTAVKTELEA